MFLLLQFHYAYRLLLTYLDRWRDLASVRVEGPSSCCHVVEARTALRPSHQTPGKESTTTTTRTPTPPPSRTLTSAKTFMKPSNAARCTIANELTRRRTQVARNPTLHARQDHKQCARLRGIAFDEISLGSPSRLQSTRRRAAHVRARKLFKPEIYGAGIERLSDVTHSDRSASGRTTTTLPCPQIGIRDQADKNTALQRRRFNMWKLGLGSDRKQSSIFAVLRQDTKQPSLTTHIAKLPLHEEFDDWQSSTFPVIQASTLEWISTTVSRREPDETPETYTHSPLMEMENGLDQYNDDDSSSDESATNFPLAYHIAAPPVDSLSPSSDTTLYENEAEHPYDQVQGHRPWEEALYDDSVKTQTALSRPIQFKKEQEQTPTPTPTRRRYACREQDMSPTSPRSAARTPIVPLRVRDRTNDGLLQLKANASNHPALPSASTNTHRRKVSLNLPVKSSTVKTDGPQHPDLGSWTESPRATPTQASAQNGTPALTPRERELEYTHRYTFIGTTSLDDFLEILEITPAHTTSKDAAAKAFVHLAANEQRHARQHSTKLQGWELVPRITPDVPTGDYVAQLQVKLGSITLRQFLDLIPFDDKAEVTAMYVVEAFLAACHLDGRGIGDKARLFRRWMIDQECHQA